MKKVLIIVTLVLLISGCGSKAEKEVLINKDSGLVGIWTMTDSKQNENDAVIKELTFQFNEDGKCIYAFSMTTGSGSTATFTGKKEGKCYLNDKNNKFKMSDEKNDNIFKNWSNYKIDGTKLTIGNYTFTKAN